MPDSHSDVGTCRPPALIQKRGVDSLALIDRHLNSPQIPDSPAGFLDSCRGILCVRYESDPVWRELLGFFCDRSADFQRNAPGHR